MAGGAQSTMPIVGGNIEELKFIPDNTIIFGYFENYVLAERAGTVIGQSEHVRFIEDQTVFKGTARYDGDLAIREAFAVYGVEVHLSQKHQNLQEKHRKRVGILDGKRV